MAVHTPETKKTSRLRIVASFVLFAVLIAFSMSMNLKTNAFNLSLIESYMLDYDYISGVREDSINYAKDLYKLNGVSAEELEEALPYRDYEQIVDAYFGFNITSRANYSEDSYIEFIDITTESFKEDFESSLKKQSKPYTEEQLDEVCNSFRNHLIDTVKISHLDKIKAVVNVGSAASNVALSTSIFFIAVMLVIMYLLGNKFRRYRSTRTIAISFVAAGIYDVLFSLMSYIIFAVKSIDIYPLYLQQQLMRYIYHFLSTVMITGGALVFVALLLLTVTWKIRKGK